MNKVADIAWLAGIIDGEGCFSVKRPIRRGDGGKGFTPFQVWLVLCNTSERMVLRCADVIEGLGARRPKIKRVWKGDKATRWQFWMHIARKDDLLLITEAMLPHLTAKRVEGEAVAWFLRRACQRRSYWQTELDKAVLGCLSAVKRNGGEAPAEVLDLLREVIPSEALLGSDPGRSDSGRERVETRRVRPNDNPAHECPAPDSKSLRVVR